MELSFFTCSSKSSCISIFHCSSCCESSTFCWMASRSWEFIWNIFNKLRFTHFQRSFDGLALPAWHQFLTLPAQFRYYFSFWQHCLWPPKPFWWAHPCQWWCWTNRRGGSSILLRSSLVWLRFLTTEINKNRKIWMLY